VHTLARNAEFTSDLGLGAALGEQLSRTQASGLAGGAFPPGRGRRVVGVTVGIDSTGTVDRQGVATVTGTLACN
jgi:hypothetical protein